MGPRLEALLVGALLSLMAVLSLSASVHRGPAVDEVAHITAGVSYLEHGDYRFNPENGLLPQALAGLPLALDPTVSPPGAEGRAWSRSDVWRTGRDFLFGQEVPWSSLMLRGRAMVVLLALMLAGAVWWQSRTRWGAHGGLLSLALCALTPELLAHGAMVTSDVAASLFFLLASVSLWRLLGRVDPWRLLHAAGAAIGMALSKFSAVLLGPIAVLMFLARLRQGSLAPGRRLVAGSLALGLLVIAGVWGAYGFRFSAFAESEEPTQFLTPRDGTVAHAGSLAAPLAFALEEELLPEAWLYGFAHVLAHARARPGFLRGDYRSTGWWWFFPYAVLVKSPLPLLALLALGLTGLRGLRHESADHSIAPYLCLIAVYWAFSLTSHLNIGVRHVLPTLPALFVLAGAGGRWLRVSGAPRVAVLALMAGLAVTTLSAWPHYLAYFNPLAGGSANGWKHLVDSSFDWGQEGPGLAEELERIRTDEEPVFLAWFGSTDPRVYGVDAQPLPSMVAWEPNALPAPLEPGLYAVSATMLQGVYLGQRGPWTAEKEADYQSTGSLWRTWMLSGESPSSRAAMVRDAGGAAVLKSQLDLYSELRFLRLSHWLKERGEPIGRGGWSVLIYRLDQGDLAAALGGAPPE
ncbi:MAG: glycosyltransferase family 39 protein [Deltaproteobacteria bacterium]|nr:glycosyltransferase family 39 protein [Deltaproteobacteria bacterium]